MRITASFFMILLFLLAGKEQNDNEWIPVKEKSDIRIFSRENNETDIKEIKAITNINASIAKLSSILMDVEHFPRWMPNVKNTKILKKISNEEIYYYVEVRVPWPFTNRDNILHIKLLNNQDSIPATIAIESVPDYIPPVEGLVRIPKTSGKWEISSCENGSTDILLEYLVDPGGKVPAWVINFFIADVPYKTFTKLKEVAESDMEPE